MVKRDVATVTCHHKGEVVEGQDITSPGSWHGRLTWVAEGTIAAVGITASIAQRLCRYFVVSYVLLALFVCATIATHPDTAVASMFLTARELATFAVRLAEAAARVAVIAMVAKVAWVATIKAPSRGHGLAGNQENR